MAIIFLGVTTTTWMQLQPSSALSRWALTRTLIRRPTQVLLEASICPIWSTRISSTTWTLTWPISNCTWFHAVGNEVAGATCRRILKTTVSSETRTEWTILVWLLTRGVSLLKTSTSPSTRAETCRPLEAQIEVARPHTALLSLKTRGKFVIYFYFVFAFICPIWNGN